MLNLANRDNTTYLNNVITAAEFNDTTSTVFANAMYSNSAIYSLPISLNILYNTILKSFAGSEYDITVSTQSLPKVHMTRNAEEEVFLAYGRVFIFIGFIFPMAALFVVHPLREQLTGIKHLQLMTGTSPFTYWFTMFLFDLFIFIFASLIIIAEIAILNSAYGLRLYQSRETCKILIFDILS